MHQESAKDIRDALTTLSVERDHLRERAENAEHLIEHLRNAAQVASQAKTDFMARMTHEMRTPLSAIIGLANLAKPLAGSPKLADYLMKITVSAKSLLDVVDDITDFSRLEKGQVDLASTAFELAGSLERVAARFAGPARDKGLALTVCVDPCAPNRLVGDRGRLEGILGHLVGNAVKFTEKGSVEISVALLAREGGTVRLAFTVRDTGIGMEQDSIPAMLDSFTQADGSLSRPYGGTGLGLALVSRGVALLGGELSVDSQPGHGTRFTFTVCLTEDSTANGTDEAGEQPPERAGAFPGQIGQPLSGTLLLLVEDNAINQQVARETLERLGAAVDVAQHGREAVEMVQVAFYDAILMDVQMPVMDGLAATRRIRALPGCADLPIVALTAHALAEDRDRCLEAGMNDYLTKPLDVDRLLTSLGQWLAPAAAAAKARLRVGIVPGPDHDAALKTDTFSTPGLDVASALLRLGGNERLLLSVAAEFTRDYADSAVTLERLIKKGNLDEARRLAHTIKGVAGNIAADALSAAARDLELILASETVPGATALQTFKDALTATIQATARLSPPPEEPPVCTVAGCWRVLLVDDAKLNRAIFSQILRNAGHEVVTAINGKDACRALFGGTPKGTRPFTLILMDIEMPEMDGLTASRIIRDILKTSVAPPCALDIPIVALTSHDAARERGRCRQAGMDECLHKVFGHDGLLTALTEIMNGREPDTHYTDATLPFVGSDEVMTPLLRALGTHLSEGSIRADEDMAVLREAFVGRTAPPELAELSHAIERYEFALALGVLHRLAEALGLPEATLPPRIATVEAL